jgi:hypothetical protein
MIVANDATIVDSQRIVLIQPSGSRIISGSTSNVFINPINDVYETDPTGSVYTGNLINQGTADFKDGATMTGSVDITGSLTVNGVSIVSGSTPTATNFNFAFGTDPTGVNFLNIPNLIGNNRSQTIKYQLVSGSNSINAGQLQVTGDGVSIAVVDIILQRNLSGAPTASFSSVYTGSDAGIKATFIGSNYIMSGSYQPLI